MTVATKTKTAVKAKKGLEAPAMLQAEDTAFAEVQQTIMLKNPEPIRVQGLLKKNRKNESLEEFLTKFFTKWNKERETIFVDESNGRKVQTDTANGTGRRRSLGDVYLICKYYYPETTLRQVVNQLYNVLPNSITKGFRTCYCTTINKRVWYYDPNTVNQIYNENQQDEFGKTYAFYRTALGK